MSDYVKMFDEVAASADKDAMEVEHVVNELVHDMMKPVSALVLQAVVGIAMLEGGKRSDPRPKKERDIVERWAMGSTRAFSNQLEAALREILRREILSGGRRQE